MLRKLRPCGTGLDGTLLGAADDLQAFEQVSESRNAAHEVAVIPGPGRGDIDEVGYRTIARE